MKKRPLLQRTRLVGLAVLFHTSSDYLDYVPKTIESADGTELKDWSAKPPNTVYVVGVPAT